MLKLQGNAIQLSLPLQVVHNITTVHHSKQVYLGDDAVNTGAWSRGWPPPTIDDPLRRRLPCTISNSRVALSSIAAWVTIPLMLCITGAMFKKCGAIVEFCWFCGKKQFCCEIPGFYNPTFLENLAGGWWHIVHLRRIRIRVYVNGIKVGDCVRWCFSGDNRNISENIRKSVSFSRSFMWLVLRKS